MDDDPRRRIILEYAKWTALSAARSGSPLRSRRDLYPLLDGVAFGEVLSCDAGIDQGRFDAWHRCATLALCRRAKEPLQQRGREPVLPVGWGAKLINVFLKTAVYVGDLGPEGLRAALHPPVDSGLRDGLQQLFAGSDWLRKVLVAESIGAIKDYDGTYRTVVAGCREGGAALGCLPIELEQFAGLGTLPGDDPRALAGGSCGSVMAGRST